jgi:outer membrane protein assembly factor BamB
VPETSAPPVTPAAAGGDWPQFQGPLRDATMASLRLARDWSARPPRPVWRRPVGEGWSGFAVSGGIAVTQEQHGPDERVAAYELATGRPLWTDATAARYETVIAGIGPRATPALHGGRVYAQGATGVLVALDLASGRRLWSRDVVGENGAVLAEWGKSGSPLVVDGRVIVNAGGAGRSLVAYDAATGAPSWAAGSGRASYSSPVLLSLAGRPQVVVLNSASVAGHDPRTGALLWETPFPGGQPNVATPLPLDADRLLVSVGYGVGSKAYRLAAGPAGALEPALLWESTRLKSKFGNLVRHGGFVYGLDDGVLTCLDPETGERRWKEGRYGHGQLLLAGGLLLVQTEEGELVLIDPSPDAARELARVSLLDGKTWNPPALAGRLLLVRNDRQAAAYELPVE